MKQKIGKLTKLAMVLLVVSFLLQIGECYHVFYEIYQMSESTSISQILGIFQTEMFIAACSTIMPCIYMALFSAQSKGKRAGLCFDAVLIGLVLISEHWESILVLMKNGQLPTNDMMQLAVEVGIPILIILAAIVGKRGLTILVALAVLIMGIYKVMEMRMVSEIMTTNQTVRTMALAAEGLCDLGIIFGLFGLRKKEACAE